MPTYLTSEQLRQRTARAVDAAVRAGRSQGLTVTDPVVLHDLFSVVVHLRPSDVVARVPVVLPEGKQSADHVSQRQRIELAVVDWLNRQDVPVVPPSPRVPLEPVVVDGFSVSLWQYVDVDPEAEMDLVANARDVALLHHRLRDYPERLPYLTQVSWVSQALAFLDANPGIAAAADTDRARREWEVLAPIVASPRSLSERFENLAMQPLHGDAPAVNLLVTSSGKRYADFEDPVSGPIEFDLALVGPEAVAAYDEAAAELGLRQADPEVLRLVEAVANVQTVACFAMVPQLPVLGEYLEFSLPQWREGPFAGGFG